MGTTGPAPHDHPQEIGQWSENPRELSCVTSFV
jgi:hypothetical protein